MKEIHTFVICNAFDLGKIKKVYSAIDSLKNSLPKEIVVSYVTDYKPLVNMKFSIDIENIPDDSYELVTTYLREYLRPLL